MKISAGFTLLAIAYVASAQEAIHKSTQLVNTLASVSGSGAQVTRFPPLSRTPALARGSQMVAAAVLSNTNSVGTRVSHGTATEQSIGMGRNLSFLGGAYYNPYSQGVYPGYVTEAVPGFYNGASHGYIRATHPGLSTGTLLRYSREVRPGVFGRAYRSLYGSRFYGYGAAERFPMDFAGIQVGLPGVPVLPPYLDPSLGSYLPRQFPGVSKPAVSATTNTGTTTVSQSHMAAPGMVGSASISTQQAQSRVSLPHQPRAE